MGYRAHVRIINEIEYGDSLGFDEPNELLEDLEFLEEEYGDYIIQWQDGPNDDLEINYKNFIEAFEKYYDKENYSECLKNLYDDVKDRDNLKNNGYIRIDWF